MKSDYYNRQGKEITIDEWYKLFTEEYKRIARDKIGESDISTVWLGLDHGWEDNSAPVIFETLVFNGPLDGVMEHYSTEEEAIKGHAAMIERVKNAKP